MLPPDLDLKPDEPLTKPRWDRAMGWVAAKIRALETFQPSWQAAVRDVTAFGLQRIEEAIRPAYQRVMALAQFGFLIAKSETAATLGVGASVNLVLVEGDQRTLFTPTEFVTLTRVSVPDDWAIARVISYDAVSGVLRGTIVASTVVGEHDDWEITASAGSVTAAVSLLADTRAARAGAVTLRDETQTLRAAADAARIAAQQAASDANAAALLIAGGPVASLNGRTGNVTLTGSDIPGLTDWQTATDSRITGIVAGAPSTLDTLRELALAINSDPNFHATVASALATKANLAGGNEITGRQRHKSPEANDTDRIAWAGEDKDGRMRWAIGLSATNVPYLWVHKASDGTYANGYSFQEDGTLKSNAGTYWHTGNFNPATKASLSGAVYTGSVSLSAAGVGGVGLFLGSATGAGYLGFFTSDGTRRGYVGWQNAGNNIGFVSENGWGWSFTQAPLVGANPVAVTQSVVTFNDVYTSRGNGTGALFLGSGAYVHNDSVNLQLSHPGSIYSNGSRVHTDANFKPVLGVRMTGSFNYGPWSHGSNAWSTDVGGGVLTQAHWTPRGQYQECDSINGRYLQVNVDQVWYTIGTS